jgi:tetratricopeptide (TPR) repeat protein
MPPEHNSKAWDALQKAVALKENASPRGQAYIEALRARYEKNPPEDRSRLDSEYAEAMGRLAERYPDDPDAATLYAEALMDTTPWDYWRADGSPKPVTETILATLESVLADHPNHPGANHLYIHAVEAQRPEDGLPMARRLEDLVPGAGHLVHMPSHIYIRTGDYHAGSLANERAVKADQRYIAQCRQQGVYLLGYVPHNWHFLWATATLEGRSQRALEAALETRDRVDRDMMFKPGFGTLQHYYLLPTYARVRFGRWDTLLAQTEPALDTPYGRATWHYARGMAHTARGELEKAEKELAELNEIADKPALENTTVWDINSMAELMAIAADVLAGELAAARGDNDTAVRRLRAGVEKEDALNYNEPPDWYYPVRHSLGAVLLEAGRPAEAEAVYRADLEKFPENGWALKGLVQSLQAQDKTDQAAQARARWRKAWRHADIEVTASRIL